MSETDFLVHHLLGQALLLLRYVASVALALGFRRRRGAVNSLVLLGAPLLIVPTLG